MQTHNVKFSLIVTKARPILQLNKYVQATLDII